MHVLLYTVINYYFFVDVYVLLYAVINFYFCMANVKKREEKTNKP